MKSSERGSILFYILIAVVLLAALSYAVVQSGRGNVQQLSDEKARLLATEIIEYGNTMASGVAQLRLRGITEAGLCFDAPAWSGDYDHAGCTDDTHKIFSADGAGLIWSQPPADALDQTASPDGLWHIYGDNEIEQIGATCAAASCSELILVADELSLNVCREINDLLGVDNPGDAPPIDADMGQTRYIGAFGYNETLGDEAGGAPLQGQTAGCFYKTGAPAKYVFYKVLIAR